MTFLVIKIKNCWRELDNSLNINFAELNIQNVLHIVNILQIDINNKFIMMEKSYNKL